MNNRVFVTGVTGKSGSYFFRECNTVLDNNHSFTFLVRNVEKAETLKEKMPSADFICGSLDDKQFLSNVLQKGKYDIILHIAGIHRSLQLVDVAVNAGVKWMILVHTTGIYSKYKAAAENYRQIECEIRKMIEGKNIAITILRPTMIYGNLNDNNVSVFMRMVYNLRFFPVVNHGRYELQPVWCGDLGKAYYQVLLNPEVTKNKDYNLSGGAPIMLIDMLKTMGERLNVKNTFFNVPFWIAFPGAWAVYLLSFKKVDLREKVQRLVEPRVYSHDEATTDFGYNPVPFEVGIKEEIEEFLSSIGTTK